MFISKTILAKVAFVPSINERSITYWYNTSCFSLIWLFELSAIFASWSVRFVYLIPFAGRINARCLILVWCLILRTSFAIASWIDNLTWWASFWNTFCWIRRICNLKIWTSLALQIFGWESDSFLVELTSWMSTTLEVRPLVRYLIIRTWFAFKVSTFI